MIASTCSSGADEARKMPEYGAAQFKDQKSGACDAKSADGHGDERRGAATRHQPVPEKEKRRPSDDDHDERNGNGSGEREGHLQSRLFDRVDSRFRPGERLRLS